MAFYDYRCERDGPFELSRPLGTAPPDAPCPACGAASRRVFSAPGLTTVPRALTAAVDHAEKTRHEPDVVTSLPPRAARRRTPVLPLTPELRKLPRP